MWVQSGDKVTFIVEGKTVRVVSTAVYAMRLLQQDMAGEAERLGIASDDEAMDQVFEMRREG
jgi:antitoxin PrlF